jgi:hypothetical protein
MARTLIAAEDFDESARLHCHAWAVRTLQATRASLVEGLPHHVVAERFNVTVRYLSVMRARFLKRFNNPPVKIVAATFMKSEPPDGLSALRPFYPELRRLVASGYTPQQLTRYMRLNGVPVKLATLKSYVRGRRP